MKYFQYYNFLELYESAYTSMHVGNVRGPIFPLNLYRSVSSRRNCQLQEIVECNERCRGGFMEIDANI